MEKSALWSGLPVDAAPSSDVLEFREAFGVTDRVFNAFESELPPYFLRILFLLRDGSPSTFPTLPPTHLWHYGRQYR